MTQNTNKPAPTVLIPLNEVCRRTGKSRWWIQAKQKTGEFPVSVTLGYRRAMFVEAEIEAWLMNLISRRPVVAAGMR